MLDMDLLGQRNVKQINFLGVDVEVPNFEQLDLSLSSESLAPLRKYIHDYFKRMLIANPSLKRYFFSRSIPNTEDQVLATFNDQFGLLRSAMANKIIRIQAEKGITPMHFNPTNSDIKASLEELIDSAIFNLTFPNSTEWTDK